MRVEHSVIKEGTTPRLDVKSQKFWALSSSLAPSSMYIAIPVMVREINRPQEFVFQDSA